MRFRLRSLFLTITVIAVLVGSAVAYRSWRNDWQLRDIVFSLKSTGSGDIVDSSVVLFENHVDLSSQDFPCSYFLESRALAISNRNTAVLGGACVKLVLDVDKMGKLFAEKLDNENPKRDSLGDEFALQGGEIPNHLSPVRHRIRTGFRELENADADLVIEHETFVEDCNGVKKKHVVDAVTFTYRK